MTEYGFNLWQDGVEVASRSGRDLEPMRRMALHYVSQYAQDGPVHLIFGTMPLPAPSKDG